MVWRRQLRTASFRKIRFNLQRAELEGGRRTADHEFPKRDEPYTEDLGRTAREFQIEAFLVGPDYMRQRDRLLKALEEAGPGSLVHPYYGKKQVIVKRYNLRESTEEGGCARFNILFREAGSLKYPTSRANPKGLLELLGSSINENSISEFIDGYGVAAGPAVLAEEAQEKVTEFMDALEVTSGLVNRVADETADFAFALSDLRSDLDTIIHQPEVLAFRIQESLSLLSEALSDRKSSAAAQRSLFGFGVSDTHSPIQSNTRIRAERNANELNKLICRAALVTGAIDLSEAEFESRQEAEEIRDAYLEEIDRQQALEDTSDDVYQGLQQLRAEIAKAVPPDGEDLPNLVTLPVPMTTNSLALSYDLYESLDLESDIIARNRIRHPGLIPGGEDIQVIRDA